MPVVVTGYIPLPCSHRPRDAYEQLGARLLAACPQAVSFRSTLASCWLYDELQRRGHDVEPGGKDTAAYHCVQHQKTAWIAAAEATLPDRTIVWIDYGILHLPGVTVDHVAAFLDAVDRQPPTLITAPSCGLFDVGDDRVNWTFCGGVLVVPAYHARWFHLECVAERRGKLPTWEVNTWAAIRRRYPERFRLYQADHNETLFTGLQA